jgi:hypothetical protein
MIKKVIKRFITKITIPITKDINKPEYLKEIERAYKAGYNYHQKAVKNDPKLLAWVLKKNYLDF